MFNKRLTDMKVEDIDRLINEKVQEDQHIEFKAKLPFKGKVDPWYNSQKEISDTARNEILKEVIAFANAYGGWLFIGIEETKDKPARAEEIKPIPNCHELAERFRLMCRDCIDPQLPVIDVAGIVTKDNDGVVVFYTPQSRAGPHRLIQTSDCYVRRADRCEKMTMREIQELTLNLERGLGAVEKTFEKQRELFAKRLQGVDNLKHKDVFGIRVTAIPLSPVHVENVHQNMYMQPPLVDIHSNLRAFSFPLREPWLDWRPILRGTRGIYDHDGFEIRIELTKDGLIEYTLMEISGLKKYEDDIDGACGILPKFFMGLVLNALCGVEKFRCAADTPYVEYAIEVEIYASGDYMKVVSNSGENKQGRLPSSQTLFPNYSLGSRNELEELAALIDQDFWNAAGVDMQNHKIEVKFKEALTTVGHPDSTVRVP